MKCTPETGIWKLEMEESFAHSGGCALCVRLSCSAQVQWPASGKRQIGSGMRKSRESWKQQKLIGIAEDTILCKAAIGKMGAA
jgi:hypothetical protein